MILLRPASLPYIIGEPFTEIIAVESTNNYAMAHAKNGTARHGYAWFAHTQTAGKGQRGKQWKSEPGQNIILSVLLDMKWLAVSSQFFLNAAIALAGYDFLKKYTGENTSIKWANDIYWNDRKAAGILIENLFSGNIWQWAIAGIGININQTFFDYDLKNPVSLKQITGKNFNAVNLAKELCTFIQKRFLQLQNGKEEFLLKEYNNALYRKNKKTKFKSKNILFECTIKEVNKFGQLVTEGGAKNIFNFGEVEFITE